MESNKIEIEEAQDDLHSVMNGRFKQNPKDGKLFLEIVEIMCRQFDGIPRDEIIRTFWGDTEDNLNLLIKKSNKREKKEKAKFSAEGLKKPPTANILFQKDYMEKCTKNDIKFNLKECSQAYKQLSDKERSKYQKESERLKEEYKVEYEQLRAAAIANGNYPADKPKRPLSAYFRYLGEIRESLTKKHTNHPDKKEVNSMITREAADMWKALSENEKAKYELAYHTEKEEFNIKYKEWQLNEVKRIKQNDSKTSKNSAQRGNSEDVKIETSQKKQVAEEKKPVEEPKSEAEPENQEEEEQVPEPIKSVPAPNKSRKIIVKQSEAAVKVTPKKDESDTEIEIPKPVKVVKPKAK